MKMAVEENLQNMNLEQVQIVLLSYAEKCPFDRDLLFYQTIFYLYKGDYDKAYECAEIGVHRYPTSEEMYYNLASVYEEKEEIIKALKYYKIAFVLFDYKKKEDKAFIDDIKERICVLEKQLVDLTEFYIQKKDKEKLLQIQSFVQRSECSCFGKFELNTRSSVNKIIGNEYWIEDDDRRYIGLYRAPYPKYIGLENMDLIHAQGEFINTISGFKYSVIGDAKEYLLPIASSERGNLHRFVQEGKEYKVLQHFDKHFNYYRVKNGTSVYSEKHSGNMSRTI